MENYNFSEFKAPDKVAGTGVKEQNFEGLKYRRGVTTKNDKTTEAGIFYVSNSKFDEAALENHGLIYFFHPVDKKTIFLAAVAEKDARMLKERKDKDGKPMKKGHTFKQDGLEAALAAAGFISMAKEHYDYNQFLTLTKVGESATIDGIATTKIYKIEKEDRPMEKKTVLMKKATADGGKKDTKAAPAVDVKAEPAPETQQAPPSNVEVSKPVSPAGTGNDWD